MTPDIPVEDFRAVFRKHTAHLTPEQCSEVSTLLEILLGASAMLSVSLTARQALADIMSESMTLVRDHNTNTVTE